MNLIRIAHTAIAVRDLDEAIPRYERLWGTSVRSRSRIPEQQVEIAFLAVGDTELELISPTESDTGVARFLERRGEGLHHVAFLVADIRGTLRELEADGVELIDREPRETPHGWVAFVHPRGTGGVLYEIVQHARDQWLQA